MTEHIVADNVVLAGRLLTMTGYGDEPDEPTAVVIADDRIAAVVPAAEAGAWVGEDTTVFDWRDKVVMPGFVDPHAHSEVAAKATHQMVDVRAPGCPDIPSVLQRLREEKDSARDGWLVGQANLFYDQKLAERRFPTREELDTVSTELAVAIRAGGHLSILNSTALERAGITAEYEAVEYSVTGKPSVMRDESGAPTGVVTEMDKLLGFPELSRAETEDALVNGIGQLFTTHGVTTIGEISDSVDGLRMFDHAIAQEQISARMVIYLWSPGTVSIDEACSYADWLELESPPERFTIHGVKVFADGGYSAKRAALSRPYADDCHSHGELALSADEIADFAKRARAAGLQLAIHANGDRAQLAVCDTLTAIADDLPPGPTVRIEHAGNFVPDYESLTQAWTAARIMPVPQPVFLYSFGQFIPGYVGDYAQGRQFPFRRMIDDGWNVSGSSDVWVGSEIGQTNPFLSIASAVGRWTFHNQVMSPEQAVSTYEALQMHTIGGAAVMGLQDSRGTVETGKFADLIALNHDPLNTAADELRDLVVTDVLLGGAHVHGQN